MRKYTAIQGIKKVRKAEPYAQKTHCSADATQFTYSHKG